jgi:hypothetical protein
MKANAASQDCAYTRCDACLTAALPSGPRLKSCSANIQFTQQTETVKAKEADMTTKRRSVDSPGSPSKTAEPKTGMNPDGRTPAELPSDPKAAPAPAEPKKAGH